MDSRLRSFEDALIVRNVVSRTLTSMEHATPEAMKDYLHEHPDADPKNHKVKKPSGGKAPKGESGGKPPIKDLVQNTKRLSDTVTKMSDQLGKLRSSFDKATGDRHGGERAKQIATKINDAYSHAIGAAETSLTHAQSAINLARKHGASEDDISRVEGVLEDAQKAVKEAKGSKHHEPVEGNFNDRMQVRAKAESAVDIERLVGALHHSVQLLSSG